MVALYLYGLYARDEARPDSDLDILVDFEDGRNNDLRSFMAPYNVLAEEFPGTEIGHGTRDSLVSHYRPYIEQSAVRVF